MPSRGIRGHWPVGTAGASCRPQPRGLRPAASAQEGPGGEAVVVQAFLVEGKAGRGQIPKFVTPVTHLVVSLSPKPNEGPAPKALACQEVLPQIESHLSPRDRTQDSSRAGHRALL